MRVTFFIFLFCCISFISSAQETPDESDSTSTNIVEKFSIEITPTAQWSTIFDIMANYVGLELSAVLREKYFVSVYSEYFIGKLSKRVVFPNFYNFKHFKIGLGGGYNVRVSDLIQVQPSLKVLFVDARWIEKEQANFYTADNYLDIFPQVALAVMPDKKIQVVSGIGYHIASSSKLIAASDSELSGVNLFAGIKFKIYSK